MPKFVVHQHTHAGWYKHTHEAATAEEAMYADLLRNHEWLPEYGHRVEFTDDEKFGKRYTVYYDGEPFPNAYYMTPAWAQVGSYWFGDQMHIGAEDDCDKCGGTGMNHYYSWRQCWECGDQELDGKGTGKMKVTA